MKALFALVAVLALAAGYLVARPTTDGASRPATMTLHEAPRELPELRFVGAEGNAVAPVALSDFRGRTVLLNLWATWCPPCVDEMPMLDALQATLGGPGFEVVALSVDRGGVDPVRAFYERTGVRRLGVYVDPSAMALDELDAVGLPTTVLIDPEGREIGRLIGPAAWDSPEMVAFLEGL